MVKQICLILFVLQVEAFSRIINHSEENTVNEKRFHEELLKKLFKQNVYNGVLMHNEKNKSEYCRKFLDYLKFQEMPTIVITANTNFTYSNHFNNNILCVVCLNSFYGIALEQLANLLNYMRSTRVIAIMDEEPKNLYTPVIKDFFQHARKFKMLNVALIFGDFYKTRKFLQYTIFPEFKLELAEYQPQSEHMTFFPERLLNLHGYKLRTIADHSTPRNMEYYNERGEKILNGYIGRFVQAISVTLNATLYFPLEVPPEVILDYRDMMGYVVNNSLDIPVCSVAAYDDTDSRDFSYPYEMGKWCMLLPIEKSLKVEELFFRLLHSPIIVLTVICIIVFTMAFNVVLFKHNSQNWQLRWPQFLVNDMAIRGAIGQSFSFFVSKQTSLKLIYVMLLLTGITNLTIFNAYLHSLLTQPPLEQQIKTYQDLYKSPLKVAITSSEAQILHNFTNNTLTYLNPKFHYFTNFGEYSDFRDKFDQHFAFPTISSKLYYYSIVQDYYNQKLLRYSDDMCPNTMMQFKFPLGPNSIFQTRLNNIIMKSLETGLMKYWIGKSFVDMKDSGRAIHLNISYPEIVKPLQVQDLSWIWLHFVAAMVLALMVFVLEIIINKVYNK